MEASVAWFSSMAIADMAATLTQSAAMVTHIAARKVSIVSSDRAIQGGELSRIKKENEKMAVLVKSLEDLKIALEKENLALKEGNVEKDKVVEKLVKTHEDNEKVIENLWGLVEEEEKEASELRNKVRGLELAGKKMAEEIEGARAVCKEIVTKSEEIYQSYKKALATFGAEPLPLTPRAEGSEGVLRLFSCLLGEFEGLQEIAQTAGDNAATVASEGLLAILRRAGSADIDRLTDRGFEFPSHKELASELESVQSLKKAFLRRFWLVSGWETMRAIATAQLEAVSVFASRVLAGLRLWMFC